MKSLRIPFTICLLISSFNLAAKSDLYSKNGLFLEGYDPVSYLLENKAKKGLNQISHYHDNTTINFSSEQNKEEFIKNPTRFIPAYNGWCAYAMAATGSLVEINPKAFKITKGRTYLFYKTFWANTLKKWNKKDESKQIESANKNWIKLGN